MGGEICDSSSGGGWQHQSSAGSSAYSLWKEIHDAFPSLPVGESLPSLEGIWTPEGKAAGTDVSDPGNLCSHPLPTAPMLNLTVDFLFLQPLHHPHGSGSIKRCRGCRWARQKAFLGWKQPELAVGSWDSTEGQPPPSLRAQKLPQSCWQ